MRRPAAVAVLLALVTSGCIHPWSARPALDAQAQKETAALLQRVRLYDDPALSEYLGGLVGRPAASIRIVRDPTLAVFATSTGEIVVHTGLLAVATSEGQLAAVLAHEVAHVTRDDAFTAGEPAALGERLRWPTTSRTAVAIFGQNLPLTARTAITGYGARRERDADARSLEVMASAGREPYESIAIYEALAAQAARGGDRELFYFGNARRLAERLASVRGLLAGRPMVTTRPADADGFERRLRSLLLANAEDEMGRGRFDLARRQLERVAAAAPDEPRLHLAYGDFHRRKAQRAHAAAERDVELVQARAAYERALVLDPALSEAHRELGLLYYAMRDVGRARGELEQYLALAPSAPDRARIEEYLQELAR